MKKKEKKVAKPKIPKPNTNIIPKRKSVRDLNVTLAWKDHPVSDVFLSKLAEELATWAKEDDTALKIDTFLIWQGISWESFTRWVERSDELKRALAFARMCIGERRELGGLRKIYDTSMIMRSMPMYDKHWKDLTEWYSKLKEGSDAQGSTIHVHMDKIPEQGTNDSGSKV